MQDWGLCASLEYFVSEIPNLAYTRPLYLLPLIFKVALVNECGEVRFAYFRLSNVLVIVLDRLKAS